MQAAEKLEHNHAPNYGIRVENCPRCEQLRAFPYVLTYKLGHHKKIQRVPVQNVRHAEELIRAQLPAENLRVPVVPTGRTISARTRTASRLRRLMTFALRFTIRRLR